MAHDSHTTTSSLTSCQWGEPTKLVSAENTEEPQQQEEYPSAAYLSMIPMAPGMGMPPMMCMMPSNCSPMYNCSSYGSHSGGPSEHGLNDTFESGTTFDSAMCAKPCEGVGIFLGEAINDFLNGCTTVLGYGENLCTQNSLVRNFKANETIGTNLPTEMIASPPHPQPKNESLTEKMDELHKLLKDKESSVGSISRSESTGIVAHSPQYLKTKAKAPSDDIGEQADQLIEMFKNINPSNNFKGLNKSIEMLKNINPINNFNGLNESAISNFSETISIGQDLLLDPTVDNETNAKAPKDATLTSTNSLLDELSSDLSSKCMDVSITGGLEPKSEQKSDGKSSGRGRPLRPVVTAATAKKRNEATEKENKVSAQIDSNSPTTKTIKAQWNKRSRRDRRVKKILKDVNDVSKMNRNAPEKVRAVNIEVEDRRISSSEKKSADQEPFVANFSSKAAVGSMGFPLSSTQSDGTKKKCLSWQNNSISKDNPSAGQSLVDASSEERICAWCRKGGTNAEIVKKLRVCSRCQVTYYCSPECQSKDWIKGHDKTCQPNPVAMY